MPTTYELCASFTRRCEGGFSLRPDEAGNWTGGVCGKGVLAGTNAGVSAPAMVAALGPGRAALVSEAFMRNLSLAIIEAAYRRYWRGVNGDALPPAVALSVFDHGFNAGDSTSAELLQECLGFVGDDVDGDIGRMTVAAVASADIPQLILSLYGAQAAYYRSLHKPQFLVGWINRAGLRRDAAEKLIH